MPEYRLIRSDRRTMALEIRPDLTVLVRAPRRLSQSVVDCFVMEHQQWITEHLEKQQRYNEAQPVITEQQRLTLVQCAKEALPQKVAYYSRLMGLTPTGVKITNAAKRYGSCSGKNSICFSWRLMLLPERCIEYVVVHELAHIRHKNHGRQFYALIEQYLPDYRERIGEIKNAQ